MNAKIKVFVKYRFFNTNALILNVLYFLKEIYFACSWRAWWSWGWTPTMTPPRAAVRAGAWWPPQTLTSPGIIQQCRFRRRIRNCKITCESQWLVSFFFFITTLYIKAHNLYRPNCLKFRGFNNLVGILGNRHDLMLVSGTLKNCRVGHCKLLAYTL